MATKSSRSRRRRDSKSSSSSPTTKKEYSCGMFMNYNHWLIFLIIVFIFIVVLMLWSVFTNTGSGCASLYISGDISGSNPSILNQSTDVFAREHYVAGQAAADLYGQATVALSPGANTVGCTSCKDCASLGSYQFQPCKCFGIQGAAINAPRPLGTSSCSSQTRMSKDEMVKSQIGCLYNSFNFPPTDCGISGVS